LIWLIALSTLSALLVAVWFGFKLGTELQARHTARQEARAVQWRKDYFAVRDALVALTLRTRAMHPTFQPEQMIPIHVNGPFTISKGGKA
jgi:hypothetical protein